jgi:hypothetical protein
LLFPRKYKPIGFIHKGRSFFKALVNTVKGVFNVTGKYSVTAAIKQEIPVCDIVADFSVIITKVFKVAHDVRAVVLFQTFVKRRY